MPPDNWIYIQEPDVQIGRLQIFNNWSPDLVADPSTVSLGLEYFCREGDELWSMADRAFLTFAAGELEKIGLIDASRTCSTAPWSACRRPTRPTSASTASIGRVRDYLDGFENLFAVGRNGMHRYNNQDHSMLAAKAAVDCIRERQRRQVGDLGGQHRGRLPRGGRSGRQGTARSDQSVVCEQGRWTRPVIDSPVEYALQINKLAAILRTWHAYLLD